MGPAITFFYRIKSFFDRLLVHRFGLEAFLSHYLPQKVLWAPTSKSILAERHLIGGHYVDMILPILARERGVELARFTLPEPAAPSGAHLTRALSKLGPLIKKQLRQAWVRASIRYEAMRLAGKGQDRGWRARLPRNPEILVLQNIYDMRYVLPELRAAGVWFAYPPIKRLTRAAAQINPEGVRHALATAWEEISRAPEFWSLLEGWEAGREVAHPWLFHLWHRVFLECWTMFEASQAYLKQKNYQGVSDRKFAGTQTLCPINRFGPGGPEHGNPDFFCDSWGLARILPPAGAGLLGHALFRLSSCLWTGGGGILEPGGGRLSPQACEGSVGWFTDDRCHQE